MNTGGPGRKQWMEDDIDLESSRVDQISPDELDKLLDEYGSTAELEVLPDETE